LVLLEQAKSTYTQLRQKEQCKIHIQHLLAVLSDKTRQKQKRFPDITLSLKPIKKQNYLTPKNAIRSKKNKSNVKPSKTKRHENTRHHHHRHRPLHCFY
jgi:hypothetical protein